MDITSLVKAGYPLLHVCTQEADRATRAIKAEGWKTYSWDCLRGITEVENEKVVEDIRDPLNSLRWLGKKADTILLVQNFHHFMNSVEIIQEIQNSLPAWKGQGSCLVMIGPGHAPPSELEKYFTMLDFSLPSPEELREIQKELGESVGVMATLPLPFEAPPGANGFEPARRAPRFPGHADRPPVPPEARGEFPPPFPGYLFGQVPLDL